MAAMARKNLKQAEGKRQKRRGPMASGPGEEKAKEKILLGAREVFSRHSFKSASTRMIAKAAGIEHPLIHYYFGSKEKLFKAVAEGIYEEYIHANREWLEGLDKMLPKDGFPVYIDRMVEYAYKNPEPLLIIFLNMAQVGVAEEIPGFHYIQLHMEMVQRTIEEKIPLRGSREDSQMFIHCFNNLVISLLGPRKMQAAALNMDPDGKEYRNWVKTALLKLFLPWLEALIFPERK